MKMKKTIGGLLVGALALCAGTAQAALTYNVTISSTSWVTVASGKTFAELGFPTGGNLGGDWNPAGGNAKPYFTDSSAKTVQMQYNDGNNLKVVKLQFRDSAGSLQAKVVWARYYAGKPLGTSLESSWTGDVLGYYIMTSLTFSPPANTVTFNFQGGSGGTEQVKASHGAAMPAATMPTKASYAFLGYFDAATGGTKYYNADGSSAKTWDKTSALTLYAQWMDCSNWTELSGSTSGKTLSTGCYFIRKDTTFSSGTAGGSGLSIADKAIVYIYIPSDVTLTATGAAGSGRTGGGAGILVPSTATLNLIGSGKVVATGGKAADG